MLKVIATDAVISKGYDGAPALKYSESGESVRFRIGKKVYDTRAENNRQIRPAAFSSRRIPLRLRPLEMRAGILQDMNRSEGSTRSLMNEDWRPSKNESGV